MVSELVSLIPANTAEDANGSKIGELEMGYFERWRGWNAGWLCYTVFTSI